MPGGYRDDVARANLSTRTSLRSRSGDALSSRSLNVEIISDEPSGEALSSAAAWRAQGEERLRANAFAEAVDLLARAVTADPAEPSSQLSLGIALQGAGHHVEAAKFFTSVQKLTPDDPVPFLHAAMSLLSLGQKTEALHAASDACRLAPLRAHAHYVYGQAWMALDEPAKAERAFAEAVRLKPDWPDAWVNYGVARYRQGALQIALGNEAEAVAAYQQVIARSGDRVYGQMARLGLAEAQSKGGQFDEAINIYKELAQLKDGPLPIDGVLMQLGLTYRDAGKKSDAEQTFNRLVAEFPESPFVSDAKKELETLKRT